MKYLKGLLAAVINGAATTVGGALGAYAVGIAIPWEVIGTAAIFGGLSGAVSYLKKAPE